MSRMSFQVARSYKWKQILPYIIIKLKLFILERTSRIHYFLRTFLLHNYLSESFGFDKCFHVSEGPKHGGYLIFQQCFVFIKFFRGIICPRFWEASQMSASDWRVAGFSDKRLLRPILIRRDEKVNARDIKKIVGMVTIILIILMMRLTLTPTLTPA